MSIKYECDRCHRLFPTEGSLTNVRIGTSSSVPTQLCDADLRDLRYFLREKVLRDLHGNEMQEMSS